MSLLVNIKKKLKGFNLEVSFETDGDYLGVLGTSGSGKSMTLKCIAGIETPDEGQIILNGKVLFDSMKKINLKPQERNVGYLFQNYALFPHMTVEENIAIGLLGSKKEKDDKVKEMIKSFHLEGLEKKYPSKLSGGQQQRVAIARCIAYRPDVLMLDEPFSALDSHLKEQLQTEVLELLKLYDGEVLMVTHSRDEAYKFCGNLVILDKGNSILFGKTKEVFKDPKLFEVAIITGCKNISRCRVLSENSVYAIDWGIILKTENILNKDINYVGIHSHDLKVSKENQNKDKNIIECKIKNIVEGVFEYNINLENKNTSNKESKEIIFKLRKEEIDNIKEIKNLSLEIEDRKILLLK